MRYLNVVTAFASEAWAMRPDKLEAVASFLVHKAAGGTFTPEEVQARIADRRAMDPMPMQRGSASDIVILPVVGVISKRVNMMSDISGGVSTDALAADISAAIADPSVRAIVLDIDSPGGSTFGMQEVAAAIRAARVDKPIVAQINATACSAAYWIASQCSEIVCTPSGEAGSIGVFCVHEDVSAMLEKQGVKPTIVQAGDYKTETSGLRPLSEDAMKALQSRVDGAYTAFVQDVAAGRGVTASHVLDRFGQGRVFSAPDLLERGMIDSIATLDETVARLAGTRVMGSAAMQMRQAFASGETPPLNLFEDVLRDAGVPKSLATDIVSRGKGALRRGDPGEEATSKTAEALDALSRALDDFALPLK